MGYSGIFDYPLSQTLSTTDCIDLTSAADTGKPVVYWLLKKLQLHEADKESLYNGKWLTNNITDAAQALLRKAYHYIGGLEPVHMSIGQTLQFTVQRGEFVQILNVPTATGSHFQLLDASLELSYI